MRLFTYLTLLLFASAGLHAQAPTQVVDIFPGMEDSSPNRFFTYGDKTLFRAETENEGVELWITDGTAAGTNLVKDINDDPTFRRGNSNPNNFTEYNGKVYFSAGSPDSGTELWVTDGTTDGTTLVLDIQPGTGNSAPFDMIVYNDLLYFTANNGNDVNGSEMWVSDGTAAGTELLVDINPNGPGTPINKFEYLGLLFFAGTDDTNGRELWSTDGTADGTSLFFDINPGTGNSSPSDFFAFGGRLIFRADNGTLGREPYNFNAVANTIGPIFDLVTGEDGSVPSDFFSVGNRVFFSGDSDEGDDGLHFVDFGVGSIFINVANQNGPTNIRELTEIVPGRAYVMVSDTGAVEDQSDFLLIDNLTDFELSIESGDGLFEDLGGADPEDLVFTGSSLYFSYENDASGRELAGLDLFADDASVVRFGEIAAGAASADVDDINLLGDRLLFEATDGTTGDELYTVDVNTAYVNLEDEAGETIANNDTLDFGTVDIGVLDSITATFNNTGNFNSRLFTFTGLFDTDIIAPVLRNADPTNNEALRPAPDNAFISFLLVPREEGEFLDTTFVAYSTASGPSSVRFLVKGNVVAPSVEAFADDESIERGDTISFAGTAVGEDSTRVVTFNNSGEGNFVVFNATLSEGTAFSIPAVDRTVVANGESASLPVTFSPDSDADFSDSLVINTNIGQFAVVLTGSAAAEPVLTVAVNDMNLMSGDVIQFNDVPARTDSTVNVIVSNTGTAPLTLESLAFTTGTFFSTTVTGFTLAPNENDMIPITFSPEAVGEITDDLILTTNAGDFIINLTGLSIINSIVDQGLPAKAVYPNPTDGALRLELEAPLLEGEWRVTSAIGQVVSQGVWPAGQAAHDLDLSAVTAGFYQVEVISGERRMTARVMVK